MINPLRKTSRTTKKKRWNHHFATAQPVGANHPPPSRMSRTGSERINGDRINGLFHLLINGVYWDYNPLTNLLLISWDIQVVAHWPVI